MQDGKRAGLGEGGICPARTKAVQGEVCVQAPQCVFKEPSGSGPTRHAARSRTRGVQWEGRVHGSSNVGGTACSGYWNPTSVRGTNHNWAPNTARHDWVSTMCVSVSLTTTTRTQPR